MLPGEGAINEKPAVENNMPAKCATEKEWLKKCTIIQKKALHQPLPLKILTILKQKLSPFPPHQTQSFQQYPLHLKKSMTTYSP